MPTSDDAQQSLTLQGSLFGGPLPASAHSSSSEPAAGELSDADLGADATARPRQRKTAETLTEDPGSEADDTRPIIYEPA